MVDIVPTQAEIHARLKIDDSNMAHVSSQQVIPILFQEFLVGSRHYPIVFVKNADTGRFQPVCVLGLKAGENKFVKNGKWAASYIPRIVRNAPLYLMPDAVNQHQMIVGIDETSARIDLEQGESLFTADGKETDYFVARKNNLVAYLEDESVTQNIIELLVKMDLLVSQQLSVQVKGQNIDLNGVYIIDEDKLGQLEDNAILTLHKNGLLPPIYAHLMSLHQLTNLAVL